MKRTYGSCLAAGIAIGILRDRRVMLGSIAPSRINQNRWYDSSVGRWISPDPSGFAAGDTNLYRYVGNSPANAVDPSGEVRKPRVAANGYRVNESIRGHHGVPFEVWDETGLSPEALKIFDAESCESFNLRGLRHINTAHGDVTGYTAYLKVKLRKTLADFLGSTRKMAS